MPKDSKNNATPIRPLASLLKWSRPHICVCRGGDIRRDLPFEWELPTSTASAVFDGPQKYLISEQCMKECDNFLADPVASVVLAQVFIVRIDVVVSHVLD